MNSILIVTFTQNIVDLSENNFDILKMKVKYIRNDLIVLIENWFKN